MYRALRSLRSRSPLHPFLHLHSPQRSFLFANSAPLLNCLTTRTVDNSAFYLKPYLLNKASLLDVGCGPGTITADFSVPITNGIVIGVDKDYNLLQIVTNTYPHIEFQVGDISQLPFGDGTFDIVHAHQLFQYLPDAPGAITEVKRVCKPGGVVAIKVAHHGGIFRFPHHQGLTDFLNLLDMAMTTAGGQYLVARALPFYCAQAGFHSVNTTCDALTFASRKERDHFATLSPRWSADCDTGALARINEEFGFLDSDAMCRIREGWGKQRDTDGAVFIVPNIEMVWEKRLSTFLFTTQMDICHFHLHLAYND